MHTSETLGQRMQTRSPDRNIQSYEDAYASDYDFEAVQVRYRREAVLRSVLECKPKVVVEIGCGLEPILPHYLTSGGVGISSWVVVEPSALFAEGARTLSKHHPELVVFENVFEDVAGQLVGRYGHADLVICSGLLHEVGDQRALLLSIRAVMDGSSHLHVNVPNAFSLHRRLAKAMGLIDHLEQFGDRNIRLQQHRVYSLQTLLDDLHAAGLRAVSDGGIFMKPFTHLQMTEVVGLLGPEILPGLARLGQEFPELASEIYVNAVVDAV
ncbi:MAG: methyltransferase domain-containing protein [Dokdonella sp.]